MSRRERKKEETRESIIECAVSFFKEKGFQETSMEEIAEKADISKGTLYNYFPDKESILVSHFQTVIAGYATRRKADIMEHKDIRESLYSLLDFIGEVFKSERQLTDVYFKYRMPTRFDMNIDSSQRSGIDKWVLEIIENAQQDGHIRKDIPAVILTRTFQFLAMSFFLSTIFTQEAFAIDKVKEQLVGLFLDGASNK